MIETFQKWYELRHEYVREWKEKTGGKAMGFFCTYVPEEILLAANILPVRILGSHEPQNVTEPHIFGMYCPFCRDCLAQGLQGRYDYLDGVMIAQSCVHIRQSYSSWAKHVPREFDYYLPMPHNVQSPRAIPFLREELAVFKKAVEQWVGKEITDADLDRGIELMNQSRQAMRDLYDTRKSANPPMTGLEAMYAAASNQWIDKPEHTRLVRGVLANDLQGRDLDQEDQTRLIILGSENDDTEFIRMVEDCGAVIVIDDHCTGSRYFWNQVEPEDDRLLAIAKRYVTRPPCPTKDWPQRLRLEHVRNLAREWDAAGAIIIQQKFCDPHELDIPAQRKSLQEIDIPSLFLELDVTVPVGQFKIRVEAFLEMLAEDDLF